MQSDRALVSSPYASFSIGTPMITLSAPLRGNAPGVIAGDLKLDKFSELVHAQRPGKHGNGVSPFFSLSRRGEKAHTRCPASLRNLRIVERLYLPEPAFSLRLGSLHFVHRWYLSCLSASLELVDSFAQLRRERKGVE